MKVFQNIGRWLRGRRVRTLTIGSFVIAFLPVVCTSVVAVWWAGKAYQEAAGAQLLETARSLSHSIGNELSVSAVIFRTDANLQLTVPVESPQDKAEVRPVLFASGSERVQSLTEAGLPADIVRQVAFPKDMALSDLFVPSKGGRWLSVPSVALSVPQGRGHGYSGVAVQIIPAAHLLRGIQRENHHADRLLITVTDSQGRVIARSDRASESIGKRVSHWRAFQAQEGVPLQARTLYGEPVAYAAQRIEGVDGWWVTVGEPSLAYNARWAPPMLVLTVVLLLAFLLGIALAVWLTRTLLQPVRALADRAQYIVENEGAVYDVLPQVPGSFVREFDQLRQSLQRAEDVLRQKVEAERQATAALALSERRYRTVAEAGALVFWVREESGEMRKVTGWKELTGQSEDHALGEGWMHKIHPSDRQAIGAEWQKALQGKGHVDVEFRVETLHGGWVWVRARGARLKSDTHTQWIGVLEDVNERRQAESRIAYLAHHDALTGLCNRVVLRQKLAEAIDSSGEGRRHAMHYIDLDRFKAVNDTLGHAVGDALLVAVTARIRALVRDSDTVARLGGDEFAIIQTDITAEADAEGLAKRLVKKLSAPYRIEGHPVSIGASVGISLIRDDDNADQILRQADGALYEAKRGGRGGHRVHEAAPENLIH